MPKQTGPKTAEGKKKSSMNALRHGLCSDHMFVLANETPAEWNRVLHIWTDKIQPRDDAEFMIVEDIAHAQWRMRRARTVECGMIDMQMDEQADYMAQTFVAPIDEGCRTALAFKTLGDDSQGLHHLHRYEVRARRAFHAGIKALKELRSLNPAPEIAAPWQPEPVPDPGTARQNAPKEMPKPQPVPAQRPAAQQHTPANANLQNEMPHRARRAAIHRVRQAFGGRIPTRIAPPIRSKRA